MPQSLDELIAGLNELAAENDEKAIEVAKAIREKAKPVAQVILNAGAAIQKTEAKGAAKKLETERDEAIRERDELRTEFDEFKAKTPNAKEIEDRITAKYEPKIKALKDQVAERETRLTTTIRRSGLTKFASELIKLGVDPEYAQEVATAKYGDRLTPKEDGSLGVLQVGNTLEYDAETEDEKIAALAADARKLTPPKFINTNADSGAGVRSGGSGGGSAATQQQLVERKQATGDYAL